MCANHSHLVRLSRAPSTSPPCSWCTTPPHIPPSPDLGRGSIRPNPLPPPSPWERERKSATTICAPGLWITRKLNGCSARYHRVVSEAPLDRIWGTLLGEVSQGAGQLCKVWNKSPIIAGQPQKPLHLFFCLGPWAGCNRCCLIYLRTHLPAAQVVPQIPYLPPSNCTLLRIGREPRLPQVPLWMITSSR